VLAGYIGVPKSANMAAYTVEMPVLAPGNHTLIVQKVTESNTMKEGTSKGVLGFDGIEITGGNSKMFTFGPQPKGAVRRYVDMAAAPWGSVVAHAPFRA
jgi:hypothetical protein